MFSAVPTATGVSRTYVFLILFGIVFMGLLQGTELFVFIALHPFRIFLIYDLSGFGVALSSM